MRREVAPSVLPARDIALRMMAQFLVRNGPTPEPPPAPAVAGPPPSSSDHPVRRAA